MHDRDELPLDFQVQYLQKALALKIDLDLFFEIGRKYFWVIVKSLGVIALAQ